MDRDQQRSFRVLLVALGIDNFGSGMFLPLVMLYLTRVVDVAVGSAGVMVALASVLGLAVPVMAARAVDSVGPRTLVTVSQLIQAAGMLAYLVAGGLPLATAGAVLSVAGLQLFYSCLSALVVDVVGPGTKDHPFALVTRVRAASFGLGALAGGVLASQSDPAWMRAGVAFNIATFLLAAVVVWLGVHAAGAQRSSKNGAVQNPVSVLSSRPFLGLMVVAFCITLPTDFLLGGNAVYVTEYLGVGAWVVGFSVALITAFSSILGTAAVRLTNRFARVTTEALGTCFLLAWVAGSALALTLPADSRTAVLLLLALLIALGNVIPMARLAAMAEATAPAGHKGRFLAAFQYPFSIAQVVAPALTSLLAVAAWLPWAVNAVLLVAALVVLRWLRHHLPYQAVYVQRAARGRDPGTRQHVPAHDGGALPPV